MPSALLRARIRKTGRRPFRRRRKRQREEQRHWETTVASVRLPVITGETQQAHESEAPDRIKGTVGLGLVCASTTLDPKNDTIAVSKTSSKCSLYLSPKNADGPRKGTTTGGLGRRWTSTVCGKESGREHEPLSSSGRRSVSFNSPFEWIRMGATAVGDEVTATDWNRYLKDTRGFRSQTGDALLTNGLERDDPEGRRVFAAMLRTRSSKMLTQPPSVQQSEKVLEWETATPGSTEVLPSRATWSGGQITTEELDDNERQNREKENEGKDVQESSSGARTPSCIQEDVDPKLGMSRGPLMQSDRGSGLQTLRRQAAINEADGHEDDALQGTREVGVGERFWAELEGLREENRLLRHESEVCRIQGSINSIRSRVCEVLSYVLYSTAFGFQSEQVDSSIQALVDDTGSWIASVVENILDKCVLLLRYIPRSVLDDGTFVSAEEFCDVDSGNESLTAKDSTQNLSLLDKEDVISSEAFVLVAVSRALGHITTINQRWSGIDGLVSPLRWDALFDIRGRRDVAELKRVHRWLHGVFSGVRSASGGLPATPGQRYACDHLARLRLRGHAEKDACGTGAFSLTSSCSFVYGGRGSAEDKVLFVPFCLANRFYALGVHSARTDQVSESFIGRAASLPASRVRSSGERVVSQNLSFETEIILRKESYKIVLRLAQGVLKLLSAAQMMLKRSNKILNTCTTLPPSPPAFSDVGCCSGSIDGR